MHDFIRVTVCHCTQELFHVVFSFIFSNYLIFNNPFKKLASTTVFHNYVNEKILNIDFMDPDYVGMVLKLV